MTQAPTHRAVRTRDLRACWWLLGLLLAGPALADGTRQLVTGGASQIEGAAGGGLVPWAVITGYSTREEVGATAFLTRVDTGDFRMSSGGAAVGLFNRVELSIARQELDLLTLGPALGFPGAQLSQNVFGAKLRLFGDVLYTSYPQVAVGLQYKRQDEFDIPRAVGARRDHGTDFYLAATKVFLGGVAGFNGFANATLRWTEANEIGLLGFGGDEDPGRHAELELSAGVMLARRWAIGIEHRRKSGHLPGLPEDDWNDVFVAWVPSRHVSFVLAYADLGTIATIERQRGWYFSVQGAF